MYHSSNFKDLTNLKFGKLVVMEYLFTKNKQPYWKCKCECGTEKIVGTNSLRNGSSSCGLKSCRNFKSSDHSDEHQLPIIRRNVLARYRCEAMRRGYNFNLSEGEFVNLIKNPCFYCSKINTSFQKGKKGNILKYNGIDRVDNSRGYELDNCVTCCKICNSKKKSVSKDIIEKAYNFLFKKIN